MIPERSQEPESPLVTPWDDHNRELVNHTHPPDWKNPDPEGRYNLVVIGGGTAGLVSAAVAAGLGGRVALVEKHLLGGDCLHVGCVPSKTLLRSAKAAAMVGSAGELGVRTGMVEVDFAGIMERMRRVRREISPHDSAARFRDLGVDVFLGEAEFQDGRSISVDGTRVEFKKAVIATGGRPVLPPIKGLADCRPLTNETLFSLTELPRRMAVIGAGPVGCEMAQAFLRFGSEVTLINRASQVLAREDPDAAAVVESVFRREGMHLFLGATVTSARSNENGKRLTVMTASGEEKEIEVDEILVSAGRAPNTESLGLEKAGVGFTGKGVEIDDRFRTTNRNIFAAGDVAMKRQFTHAADFAARAVVQNALFLGRKRLSALNIPWCTYSDPEVAHVGISPREAEERGIEIDTWERRMADVDRARADGETQGFVKIYTAKGRDRILGATIVASHAGDLISEVSTAMAAGMGLGKIASVIHPYPTQAEAIRQLGDAYNKTKLTPGVAKLFHWWLAKTR